MRYPNTRIGLNVSDHIKVDSDFKGPSWMLFRRLERAHTAVPINQKVGQGDNIKNDCSSRELHAHSGGRPEDAGDGLAREVWLSV